MLGLPEGEENAMASTASKKLTEWLIRLNHLVYETETEFEPEIETFMALIGAAAGATINLMFMSHFQDVSRGHFTVRRLERQYGQDVVRAAWQTLEAGDARVREATRAFHTDTTR